MKAIRIEQPDQASVVDVPIPEPAGGDVILRVMASGICGTDIHIFRGEYLGGYPVIPGHEFSGEVVRVGAGVTRFKPGDRVAVEPNIACDNCFNCLNNRQNFCLNWKAVGVSLPGGMAEFVAAPEKAVFSIGDLSYEAGAFVEPLSCVLHGMQRANLHLADRVAILGAGPIGCQLLQTARLQGAAHITILDKNPARLKLGRDLGANECFDDLSSLTLDGYDAVIDATGSVAVMARSLDFARYGGTVLLFGVPPSGKMLEVEAFKIFRKGLTILSSFTSVRNSYQAVELLRSGRVDVSQLVSHRLPLQEFTRGIHLIENGLENVRKVLIVP